MKCGEECEVYSRVVGYLRPVKYWNLGKQEEFKDRVPFNPYPKPKAPAPTPKLPKLA